MNMIEPTPIKGQTPRKPIPRIRQVNAAKAYIENVNSPNPIPLNQLLVNAGYNETSAESPHRVIRSIGFKAALAEMGLTEDLVTNALVEDIEAKPKNRIRELSLAADILGMRRPIEISRVDEDAGYANVMTPEVKNRIRVIEDEIKNMLAKRKPIIYDATIQEDEKDSGTVEETQ